MDEQRSSLTDEEIRTDVVEEVKDATNRADTDDTDTDADDSDSSDSDSDDADS